jgi:prepilin-type N-terminal cleavage/methylation domain-containing protein
VSAGFRSALHPVAVPGRGGFSLLEVLVAMVILTVGATSLIALFAAAAATHKRAVDRLHASEVAEEVLAEVRARYLPGKEPEEVEASLRAEVPASIDGYTWNVYLVRPGAEEPAGAGGSKTAKKKPSSLRPRKAPDTRTVAKKTGAPDRKGSRSAAAEPSGFADEELLVRVVVGWSQSGRALTESFDTLILPRPVVVGSRLDKR